jgi:FtsP/CotA-like multicopper oxidase with cupredoxin domain
MKAKINRRTFLKTALGTLAAAGFSGFSPTDIFSESKRPMREFKFSASPARVNLGVGPDFNALTFNGKVPGPEIRVREGEIIRVVLKNYLSEGTTIHWHGIPVPNAMDGVPGVTQEAVMPGESFVYEFEAKPSGSYIYHSHFHYQLDQGLYGALIIEPSRQGESYDQEHTLLLEDWVMKDGGGVANTPRRSSMGMMRGMGGGMMGGGMMRGMMGRRQGFGLREGPLLEPFYDGYAVNGKVYPAVDPIIVSKGDRVKLRLLNPSSATIYELRLAGHPFTVTHADGIAIMPVETDVLRIGMGERYDVMFVADNPGYWLLAARESGLGEGMLQIPLRYKGVNRKDPLPPEFRPGLRLASFWNFQALFPSGDSLPEANDRVYPQRLSGGMHTPFWTINGQIYPDAENLAVRQGERVRILYWNQSMMPHPMHLHGHSFKVANPFLPRDRWIMKDTVIVDPMSRVEIEFLSNNPGRWFHHCHNLYHMEAGMANVIAYQT